MSFELDAKLLETNKETEILSAYVVSDRMSAVLKENEQKCRELADIIADYNPDRLLLVGSGASYCTLYTAYVFLNTHTDIRVSHMFGPELITDDPSWLKNEKVLAIVSSYSGKTADTNNACSHLEKYGIPRIALCKEEDSKLAGNCQHVLAYHDKCLYTSAMTSVLMLLCAYADKKGNTEAAKKMLDALKALPEQMKGIIGKSEKAAMEALSTVRDEDFFYVMGDGALWGLAYQYGYTNLMEYSRVHSACLRACEWRHGPLEILFRKPAIVIFVADDKSREYTVAAKEYCEKNGGKVVVFDVKDYFDTHPALAPFVLHAVSQFFFLYQATDRNINMDEYLEMHVKPFQDGEQYF
jgi:fructoselysine 6-phosphate deglycase